MECPLGHCRCAVVVRPARTGNVGHEGRHSQGMVEKEKGATLVVPVPEALSSAAAPVVVASRKRKRVARDASTRTSASAGGSEENKNSSSSSSSSSSCGEEWEIVIKLRSSGNSAGQKDRIYVHIARCVCDVTHRVCAIATSNV